MINWVANFRAHLRKQVGVTSLLLGCFALLAFLISFVVAAATWIGSDQVVGTINQVHSDDVSRDAIGKLRPIEVSFELDNKIATHTIVPRKISHSYDPGDEIELLVMNDKVSIRSIEEQFGLSVFLLAIFLIMMTTWAVAHTEK